MSDYTPAATQKRFMESPKYVRLLGGPVGGGKSVACVHELVRLACGQEPDKKGFRRSRAIIVRNTSDQLTQTTRKTVFDWLPPGEAGSWAAVSKTFTLHATLGDGTTVLSEWLFIPLDTPDDVRKALSLEATFLWGNECRELHPDVIDGLLGRLNRYPSMKDGPGPTRSCAIFDTNMPDEDTYWHEQMVNPPQNWDIFIQPPAIISFKTFQEKFGLDIKTIELLNGDMLTIDPGAPMADKQGNLWVINPEAENLRYLSRNYYPELVPGKTEDWLRVYMRSEYGRSLSGMPVYDRSFVPEFHIAENKLLAVRGDSYPIVIGIDFGRTPAAVFKQRDPRGRILTLGEIVVHKTDSMGLETFIKTRLQPYIARRFAGCTFICGPDPAGFARTQLNEMTLVDALTKAGFKCVKPPTNDPDKRIEAVERLLGQHIEGRAMYLVDPEECPTLIKGFRYGYRFKIRKTGELEDKPDKNEFSHVHDANQYADSIIDMNVRGVMARTGKREVKKVVYPYS